MSITQKNRSRVRIFLATILLGLVATSAVIGIKILPPIVVDELLAHDIKKQAILWEDRVINRVSAGKNVFQTQILTNQDIGFLRNITLSSDIYRFSMITPEGLVFWSSNDAEIGRVVSADFFSEIVTSGEHFYMHEPKEASEVDHFNLHALGNQGDGLREVAMVFTPVIQNGVTLGAIEFYTDITQTRETFITRTRYMLAALAFIALALMTTIAFLIVKSSSRSMKLMHAQATKERDLLDQQLQMAREVQLLGELNEWLQSSRSLEELFDMVSRFMSHILPACEGSIYVYSNSRDVLDGHASWNGGSHKDHIHPDACWGLRRGRTYSFGESEVYFHCEHIELVDERPYFCFPILAHGETVGLMTLRAVAGVSAEEFVAGRKLSQMCAEQISMAIANVRMRDQLHDQSVRDPLTGLYNRRHLTECLRKMIGHSNSDGTPFSLVSIDVDHFKKFNDNHGHDAGDMVLRAVGTAMSQQCDGDETACRPGGEEFMMLLPDVPKEKVFDRAEKLRKTIEEVTVRYGEKALPRITISVGVSHYPDHGTMPQDLMRAADEALYEAKAKGRNQTVIAGQSQGDDAGAADPIPAAEEESSTEELAA